MKTLLIELPDERVASVKATLAAHAIPWRQPEVATPEERADLERAVAKARGVQQMVEKADDENELRPIASALLDLVEGLLAGKVRL